MATIDIRSEDRPVENIRFADSFSDEDADMITKNDGAVYIVCEDYSMKIAYQQDAENLIKALQKAIELGWWQDKPAGV